MEKRENSNRRVVENAALITASPLLLAVGGCCLLPVVLVVVAVIFSFTMALGSEVMFWANRSDKPPAKTQVHQVNVKKK